jgi:ribonuclease HI
VIIEQDLKNSWKGNTLSDCFKNWFEDKTVPTPITAHICWFIWLERNKAIFEETTPSLQAVIYKTLAHQNRVLAPLKDRPSRDILILQLSNTTLAWFDGATQLDGISCGAGGVIKTPDLTVIRWIYNCGRGTNTRAELMGAWATLMLADHLSLHRLQVMGDSRVVIDWLSNRGRLQVCAIEGWKSRIKDLIKLFQSVSFEHISEITIWKQIFFQNRH